MTAQPPAPKVRVKRRNHDAERALCGGLMLWPNEIAAVSSRLPVEAMDGPFNRNLYRLILELSNQGPVTPELVCEAAWDRGLSEFGGAIYVNGAPGECPSVEALHGYARVVQTYHARRKLYQLAIEIRDVSESGASIEAMFEQVDGLVTSARPTDIRTSGPRTARELADETATYIAQRYSDPRDFVGIPTGFRDLDAVFAISRTDLVIVGARPAMGKTAYALNLLMNMAEHTAAAMFSMEMSSQQLVMRLLARETGIDTRAMHTGRLDPVAMGRVEEAAGRLGRMPFYVDDTPGLHIGQIRARTRDIKARCPDLGIVFIDYLQLCEAVTKGKSSTRQEAVAETSRGLKVLAKEFDVAVVALSQLNRGTEHREKQIPQVSDLRESGSLEQDADSILLLYREEVADPDTDRKGVCDVIIGKQRSGQIGKVSLAWSPERQRFSDLDQRHMGAPIPYRGRSREGDEW